jgi:hypothetical protein
MEIDPNFLATLEALVASNTIQKSENVSEEIVSFTAQEFVKRLLSINPYLGINQQQVETLEEIYRQTWQRIIKTGNIKASLRELHYPELAKWLASLYPEKFRKFLKSASVIGNVTYGEYSAEFQVELFGIDVSHMQPPVLDIGCGGQANLVRYLRSLSVDAYGIDRYLEIQEPYLEQIDWFEYDFQPCRWGTIISNMAFTNHLKYAYLHDRFQLEQYLIKMKQIAESLSMGGSFHYAPSLPFVEDQLSEEKYRVKREQKRGDTFVSLVIRIA